MVTAPGAAPGTATNPFGTIPESAIRPAFPALEEFTYLNTGTMGLMAVPVADRYVTRLREFEVRGLAAEPEARRSAESARSRLAAWVRVTPDELALTGNATDGITLLVSALTWQPGDAILISDQEHPALTYPVTYVAQRTGVAIHRFHVASDPDETLDSVRAALGSGPVRLVAFSHVTSQTGTRLPAREIARAAREAGALSLLDMAQSFGQLAPADLHVPMREVDAATSNGHKWLGAGKGTGFLYVRAALLDQLSPALVGAGALRWPQALGDAPAPGSEARLEPVPSARRFEFGTRNWMLYASLPLALDWLDAVGWDTILTRERTLVAHLCAGLSSVPGVQLLSPAAWNHGSAMTAFTVPDRDMMPIARHLWEIDRIRNRTVPELNAIRLSTAYYNNTEDVDRALAALAHVLR